MSLKADIISLYHLAFRPLCGRNLAEQTERFYRGQADSYDAFREKMLHGREDLYRRVSDHGQGVWVDIGGGTGWCFERIADRVAQFDKIYLVDTSSSLLDVARRRIARMGWTNVEAVQADGMTFTPAEGSADIVTCSYALSMVHDWMGLIWHVRQLLKPGGRMGIVDFYVGRKFPVAGKARHSRFTRFFYPAWFDGGNIHFSPDMLRFVDLHFHVDHLFEGRGRLPYTPFFRVPYFVMTASKV